MNTSTLKVWRTITLGAHKDADGLRSALKKAGCRTNNWANDILGKITLSPEKTEIDLVVLTVAELGFPDGARYDALCTSGKELGLHLCPAEVGPKLRLEYADQPKDEWLRIAMEPITDSDGRLRIFHVVHDERARWLDSYYGNPGSVWLSSHRFVFVRPR